MSERRRLGFLQDDLSQLERRGLRRDAEPRSLAPGELSFASNDYLGLAASAPPTSATTGAGAARLIAGERAEHRRTERAFAEWLELEDALLFTSGYAANVGLVSALAGPEDLVVSDALNHASLIDGARLSRAKVVVVPHADAAAVRAALAAEAPGRRRALVLVESYYSMDADGPDLAALRAICDEHGAALIVDEAHALGVLGPGGRGRCAEAGIQPDALVGTLGKSFGSQGAFVAGPKALREWLWNRARSFVFSTGLAPVCAAAAFDALALLRETPALPGTVLDRARQLRAGLARLEPRARIIGFGHVVPVVVGSIERALALSALAGERGLRVPAIRPPTVPEGTARLRLTVTARLSPADIEAAAATLIDAASQLSARSAGP
jgi:8-amino-7-oxononanoate synthase